MSETASADRARSYRLTVEDRRYLAAFESCCLSNAAFRHDDHIRIAWMLLTRQPLAQATECMVVALRRRATHHHGDTGKYHDTMTRVWMHLVRHAMDDGMDETFADFAASNLRLFDKQYPLQFYSKERLMSAASRERWLEPDLEPLPPLPRTEPRRTTPIGS